MRFEIQLRGSIHVRVSRDRVLSPCSFCSRTRLVARVFCFSRSLCASCKVRGSSGVAHRSIGSHMRLLELQRRRILPHLTSLMYHRAIRSHSLLQDNRPEMAGSDESRNSIFSLSLFLDQVFLFFLRFFLYDPRRLIDKDHLI